MISYTDPANLPESSCHDDPIDHTAQGFCRKCLHEVDLQCPVCRGTDVDIDERHATSRKEAEAIARFCVRLLEMGRSKSKLFQSVNAYAFAAHIHPEQNKTVQQFARDYKISKQAFAAEVNHIRDRLGLPRIAGAKSHTARKTYSQSAKKAHERRNHSTTGKPTATFIGRLREASGSPLQSHQRTARPHAA